MSRWFPGSDSSASLDVAAFTEDGAAPSIPGPLVRVPVGTTVSVSVKNELTDTVFISGLRDPAKWDSLVLAPGARGSAMFTANRAGCSSTRVVHVRRGEGPAISSPA
jgi:FtsP/CotA-like multicopper oxidase with cupredoxin domain